MMLCVLSLIGYHHPNPKQKTKQKAHPKKMIYVLQAKNKQKHKHKRERKKKTAQLPQLRSSSEAQQLRLQRLSEELIEAKSHAQRELRELASCSFRGHRWTCFVLVWFGLLLFFDVLFWFGFLVFLDVVVFGLVCLFGFLVLLKVFLSLLALLKPFGK